MMRKPFDIEEFIETVRGCDDHAPRGRHRATRARGEIDLAGLQRFVRELPALRALLESEAASLQEMLLRKELRRTAQELSDVLTEAAMGEPDRGRAAILRGTARVAASVAGTEPATSLRDH